MTWRLWLPLVVLWIVVGLAAVFFLLHRRGFREPLWYLIGGVLGPLFVPMAVERSRRRTGVVERRPAADASGAGPGEGITLVVGVDGSPEADRALADAALLAAPVAAARIVLVTVIGVDEAEGTDGEARERARRLLADAEARLPAGGGPVEMRVLSGRPASALADAAAGEAAAVLVVGRRGTGLSRALLGSVAEQLGHECSVPVLLAGPVTAPPR
ncbi:universal stress protein [Blastococcus sp. SYSU D01042]